MKKSHKKRMIYDAMALRLAVALEAFIDDKRPDLKGEKYRNKIHDFSLGLRCSNEVSPILERIFGSQAGKEGVRHLIAHPRRGSHIPYLGYDRFQKFRDDCTTLDACFKDEIGESPMSKIMFYSLPYDMGNAGDLIKHGALSIAVRWWHRHCARQGTVIHFADPFGGCPWEEVESCEIKRRLLALGGTKLGRFVGKCLWDGELYYNSGHIARRAVSQSENEFEASIGLQTWTSDRDEIARSDLVTSGLLLLDKKYKSKYDNTDAYSILDYADDFHFILLDPFDDFVPRANKHFERILDIVVKNPNIIIMVFVLDKYTEAHRQKAISPKKDLIEEKHNQYDVAKEGLEGYAFSLRCPPIKKAKMKKDTVEGESDYDLEVLLISQQFANNTEAAAELRKDLQSYADALTEVFPLGDKKIKFWPK